MPYLFKYFKVTYFPLSCSSDITSLNSSHVGLLERLYDNGVRVMEKYKQTHPQLKHKHLLPHLVAGYLSLYFQSEKISDVRHAEHPKSFHSGSTNSNSFRFNYPVSIYHLHLHLALPPFNHMNCFRYPRFHPYEKVLKDLKMHGRVITYTERPNEEEGDAWWNKFVKENHQEVTSMIDDNRGFHS